MCIISCEQLFSSDDGYVRNDKSNLYSPFYYKVCQFLLPSAWAFVVLQSASAWITKCVNFLYYKVRWFLLHSVLGHLLQSVSIFITRCVRYCKVCQGVLQSALGITKCGFITKWVSTQSFSQFLQFSSKIGHYYANFVPILLKTGTFITISYPYSAVPAVQCRFVI